jgi:predicted acylesterase/phospholipase RssA
VSVQGPIKLQFAFQGGGARLAPLLAAAHGVYLAVNSDNSKKAEITNISGTSAGAIAAAILASRKDPENFLHPLTIYRPIHGKISGRGL